MQKRHRFNFPIDEFIQNEQLEVLRKKFKKIEDSSDNKGIDENQVFF